MHMKQNSQPPDSLDPIHPAAPPISEVPKKGAAAVKRRRALLLLGPLDPLAGLGSGLICAVFRMGLVEADRLRSALIAWAQGESMAGFMLVLTTCAAGASVAAWMVRRFVPSASGSGIPQVEAVLNDKMP